jgi:cytoskeletal protein CcmA (bactofilin family)
MSSSQPSAPERSARPVEPAKQRPLPTGVVGLAALERGRAPQARERTPGGTLIVGQGIQVKGQVDSCRTLIVEGRVEASLAADTLEVRAEGRFKGTAEVATAEIAGSVDGTLTVRDLLTVKAGGRVSGTLRYARIHIETGGEISGDVGVIDAAAAQTAGHVA